MEIQENDHSVPGQLIVYIVLNMYCIGKSKYKIVLNMENTS